MIDAAYIRARRESLRMTQVQAAAIARVSPQTWNRIEHGRGGNVTIKTIERLALSLNVKPQRLVK